MKKPNGVFFDCGVFVLLTILGFIWVGSHPPKQDKVECESTKIECPAVDIKTI